MNKDELQEFIKKTLNSHLNEPGGRILYSSHETLKPGPIYLLGYNPGGVKNEMNKKLADDIDNLLRNSKNAYFDEDWTNKMGAIELGKATLQLRLKRLFDDIHVDLRSVCASNLIFLQSSDANGIDYKLSNVFWPVHEKIIEIVKPKIIICFGNSNISPFEYIRNKYIDSSEKIVRLPAGHGNWSLKGFNCKISGRDTYIAGLPHLSRYSPDNKKYVTDWLQKYIT